MALSRSQIELVEHTIGESLRKKFATYNPEPAVMPFHTRLLGKDRLALYAFIHSLNTSFGTAIFEPVAAALAAGKFKVTTQAKSGTKISTEAQFEIQKILDALTASGTKPDKLREVEAIRRVCQAGEIRTVKPTRIDLLLENDAGVYLFDIKTAKPNKGGFKEFKRTLLQTRRRRRRVDLLRRTGGGVVGGVELYV